MNNKTDLLDLFERYLSDPVSFSDHLDDFKKNDPALAERFTKFSSILQKKYINIPVVDETISKINDQLLQYAQNNYFYHINYNSGNDVMDSLISSMNMLGEEINHSTVSRLYFTEIFNTIPDFILIVNDQGIIKTSNHSFVNQFDTQKKNIIGLSICEIFKENYTYQELLDKVKEGNDIMHIYLENDSLTPVTIKLADFDKNNKGKNGKVFILRDISEIITYHQKLEKTLKKAQESDRLKSAFLANMSHEIRTPMNGILGFTELLKTENISKEKEIKFIEIIQKSGNRMLNTVNDIIDISKIQAGQMMLVMKEMNIVDEVNNLFEFFRKETDDKGLNLHFECSIKKEEGIILSDKNKISSILTNLIKNAIKFTDTGDIIISCNKENNSFVCSVKDTGIGIPKNRQKAIFDPFIQADIEDVRAFQGSGLGLAITQSYVKMLNGSLSLSSSEGKGATFTFNIPWQTSELKLETNKDIFILR